MILQIGKTNLPNKTGFTLVELILVILLILLITGLSTPLFRRTLHDLTIKNASLDLAKLINYAQEMAIIEKVTYKLNVDAKKSKYWLTRYSVSDEGVKYEKIKGRYGKGYLLPRGLGIACDKKEINFYPDGRSDEVEIKIIDEKSQKGYLLDMKGFGTRIDIEEID